VNVFNIDRVPRGNDDAGGEEHGYSVKATMKQLAGLNIKHLHSKIHTCSCDKKF